MGGESDYSALLITYTKKCRSGHGVLSSSSHGSIDLEHFRQCYPMDDRALAYLAGSPPEVQRQVAGTFQPPWNPGDSDFSSRLIAYVKICRAKHSEALTGRAGPEPPFKRVRGWAPVSSAVLI